MGMAGLFLTISPKLRDHVVGGFTQASTGLEAYSPFSYIALAVAILGGLLIVIKPNQPR